MLEETNPEVFLNSALEPQNNLDYKGSLKIILSPYSSVEGQLQHVGQGFDKLGFEHLQGWRLYSLPGKAVERSGPSSALLMNQVFPLSNLYFPCSSWCLLPITVYHWGVWLHLLFCPALPEASLLHAEQAQFSTSSHTSAAPIPSPSLWPPLDSILFIDVL